MIDSIKTRTYIWFFVLTIAIISYMFSGLKLNYWKLSLVGIELAVSICISIRILQKEIFEIIHIRRKEKSILRIYLNTESNSSKEQELIEALFEWGYLIPIFFALFLLTYLIANFDTILKLSLVFKTIVSITMATGCIFVFGKTSLEYANSTSSALLSSLAAKLSSEEEIKKYEE